MYPLHEHALSVTQTEREETDTSEAAVEMLQERQDRLETARRGQAKPTTTVTYIRYPTTQTGRQKPGVPKCCVFDEFGVRMAHNLEKITLKS